MSIQNDPMLELKKENDRLRAMLRDVNPQRAPLSPINLSSEKLQTILEEIPLPIAWAGANGKVEFINRRFRDLFGYDTSDFKTLDEWVHLVYPDPVYRTTLLKKWKASVQASEASGEPIPDLEMEITGKDSSIRTVNVKTVMIGKVALAIFDDLTESNRARKALLESESLFKTVFNKAKNGILVADGLTQKFLLANDAILTMMGYTEDELLNLQVSDMHPKESLKEVIHYFERQMRGDICIAPSIPMIRKDGQIIHVDISSGPIIMNGRVCLLGIFHDISERKKYEEKLLAERDFSDAALNSLPGIFYMFDQNGRFLRWNRNFETVSGYSADEMKRISPFDLFQGEDRRHIHERIKETFIKGASDAEANFTLKNGNKIPYYFTGVLAHIDGVPCIIGMGIDISRRKQAEKMQALGQLAGGIAHDFNNQLSAILGFSEMIANKATDETLRHYADMIGRAATRSANLTRQLLAFAHKGKYQIEPVDIHMIIDEVVIMLNRSIDKRITIKKNLNAAPATILGDPGQISSAFLNLAINGRDAMPEGGELIFETSHMPLDAAFCRETGSDISPGVYLKIDVADTGHGMDETVLQHIYEPFFTTKKAGDGTGMGLPAVYGTIKNHKGAITVESRPGKGSIFSVFLPLSERPLQTEPPLPPPEIASENKKGARILIVDDENMIRQLAKDVLTPQGYEVVICRDGIEAKTLYEREWSFIQLVILDLMMPNLSGAETFISLKKINPNVKVILSSGYSLDGETQSLLEQGAVDFIQKPFRIRELTKKVSEALNP